MIDYKTYRRFHPRADAFQFPNKPVAPFDRWPEVIPHNATLDENLTILLPPLIHGFFSQGKEMGYLFRVRNIKVYIANPILEKNARTS
jgi:hypothetical protein